jgi:hypothetical protein
MDTVDLIVAFILTFAVLKIMSWAADRAGLFDHLDQETEEEFNQRQW